jgi:hypothetical protein
MGSWQNGVNAVAEWLANHKSNGQTSFTSQGTQGISNDYQNVVAQAPAQLQSSIKSLPDGTAYIDSNSVPTQFAIMANNFASGKGIKVLNSQDATSLATINQSIKNMQTLSNTFGGGSSTKKEDTPVKKDLVCPAGQIPCMFNKNKCYDPTLPSFVDPCA